MSIAERIRRPGPKKILALDGGGILGLKIGRAHV